MLKFKKNDCLYRIIKANSNNTKKLFKLVSEITGNSKPNPMPECTKATKNWLKALPNSSGQKLRHKAPIQRYTPI